MATKKPAPKKATAKVAAKKPAAKPAKKAAPKPAAKKVVAKKVAPKPAPKKVAAKKAAPKPAPKKVAAKKAAPKPAPKKAVAKKVAPKAAPKPAPKKAVAKKVAPKPALKKAAVVKPVVKEKVIVKPEVIKEKKVKEKVEKPEKVKKERKGRAKKPKRIIRVPKPPKAVKAAGIEKATTVIPIKKIAPKVKEEPLKNVKVPKITTKSSVSYTPDYVPMDKRKEEIEPQVPLVRYNDTELNEFRELIAKKLEAAKKELAYLQSVITRKDDMGGDNEDGRYMTMEDGSLSMEREQMSNMASRQITYIDHLEKALQRIENKTYGICRVTGKLIDKARLRAVPHATLSLEAKLGLVKAGE
ncbi:MAG: TraR/DksA family transcriptional regulator [Chitinophagaceae bacterium]|nr:TraR/DksA family transcriptional regulator [Chitinophagaceae bacterium]